MTLYRVCCSNLTWGDFLCESGPKTGFITLKIRLWSLFRRKQGVLAFQRRMLTKVRQTKIPTWPRVGIPRPHDQTWSFHLNLEFPSQVPSPCDLQFSRFEVNSVLKKKRFKTPRWLGFNSWHNLRIPALFCPLSILAPLELNGFYMLNIAAIAWIRAKY